MDNFLTIKVAPGYAFDFLSIYQVKLVKNPSELSAKNYTDCLNFVALQIGMDRVEEIIKSKEYEKLFDVNEKLYNLVELAREDKVKASDVDRAVIDRWKAKIELQNSFFPSVEMNEQKFNKYEK